MHRAEEEQEVRRAVVLDQGEKGLQTSLSIALRKCLNYDKVVPVLNQREEGLQTGLSITLRKCLNYETIVSGKKASRAA
jgi:hypothetical protein